MALRMMEERKLLMAKLATDYRLRGPISLADTYTRRATEIEDHIKNLKELLYHSQNNENKA